ncbi:hypothetical protein [Actinopolymorpha sp. B9G3]|uniref:hypothetical protein n=1 Tax=Actinopolymorpha sp. B9G3 TaxID=3158970 RepID=UPI0032D93CE3
MPYTETIEAATDALRRAWGTPVNLRLVDVVVDHPRAAAALLRARLDDPPPGRPCTVIVKKSNTPEGVEMEWAGLAFLAELAATQTLVPQLLAGDAAKRLIVMTDLADHHTQLIGDLLFSDDCDRAEEVLNAAQAALGRLNAAGIAQQHRYDQVRAKRSGAQASRHAVNKLDERLAVLPQVLTKHLRAAVPRHRRADGIPVDARPTYRIESQVAAVTKVLMTSESRDLRTTIS